jgi:Tol biopolymer transport system component
MRLSVVDREGRVLGNLSCPEGLFTFGNISQDGSRLAVAYTSTDGTKNQIWAGALPSGSLQPLTYDGYAGGPVISPDGKQVNYVAGDSDAELWRVAIGDPGSAHRIAQFPSRFTTLLGYTPDGRGLIFRSQGTETRQDLGYLALEDTSHAQPILATRFNEPRGAISPDGKWLAYVSDESGRYECRVRPFGTSSGTVLVVSHGAWTEPNAAVLMGQPAWRRDGRELAYIGPDAHSVMSVAVSPGNPPVFGEPRLLFRYPSAVADIAMSPGLDRFVLSIIREDEGRSAATVVLHWPKLLEARP